MSLISAVLQEYDFVFTVDIDDERQLKLPYNKSEDPWFAAQAFIHKHNLPQGYLEQVANFIINNSKQGNVSVSSAPPEFADPFTGLIYASLHFFVCLLRFTFVVPCGAS